MNNKQNKPEAGKLYSFTIPNSGGNKEEGIFVGFTRGGNFLYYKPKDTGDFIYRGIECFDIPSISEAIDKMVKNLEVCIYSEDVNTVITCDHHNWVVKRFISE